MNSHPFEPWESANWPVIVADSSLAILCYNAPARDVFELHPDKQPSLKSLWASGNELAPGRFLEEAMMNPARKFLLHLSMRLDQTAVFQARAIPFHHADGVRLLIQLFQEETSGSGQTEFLVRTAVPDVLAQAQKQKLDCALKLARTMALDFNNTLTSILGHTSLLLSQMDAKHPWRKSLVEVEKAAEKAAEIAEDLALFSRQEKSSTSHAAGNLNDIVRRSVQVMESAAGGRITWKLHLESRLFALHFDEAKLQQAFVKVLENAVEAIPDAGQVVVMTRNREVTEAVEEGTTRLLPGHYICAEISDSGTGIAPATLPRIFEPFFTTKQGHRGLGLAWVYGIITNHGGSVAVTTKDSGTTVRIYLPATNKFVKEKTVTTENLHGKGTILLVDDEDLLLTMGQMILESYGYTVLTANDGTKAMDVVTARAEDIDLVITDMVMPNMSGRELVEKLAQIIPGRPVICMTGYLHPGLKSVENCLQKPFTSQSLLSKVKEALNANLLS